MYERAVVSHELGAAWGGKLPALGEMVKSLADRARASVEGSERLFPFPISCRVPLGARVCFKKMKIKHHRELCLRPRANTFSLLLAFVHF